MQFTKGLGGSVFLCASVSTLCVLFFSGCGNSGPDSIPAPTPAPTGPVATSQGATSSVGNIQPGDDPLSLMSYQQLDNRLLQLTFATPALPPPSTNASTNAAGSATAEAATLPGSTNVRVLVPAGYAESTQRYPVLYLLHGALGNYTDWTEQGNVEAYTAGLPLIVVMPDGGDVGEYSDYYNNGSFGPPDYETYHVSQLVPWIDANFRTIPSREARAIGGLSMGGFGAMSYAARHPDMYVSASSFSGAVDTNYVPEQAPTMEQIWGPHDTQEVRWRGSNPVDLAMNLQGLSLAIRTGNGLPGGQQTNPDPVEYTVHQESVDLHNALTSLGIPHLWDDYGPGGHAWSYWQADLVNTLPTIMQTFANPPPPPERIQFTSIASSYSVYGWRVDMQRPVTEFSTLSDAGTGGFTLSGSGRATVTTPPLYVAGHAYRITVTTGSSSNASKVTADTLGQLGIAVPLGPANLFQQFTAAAQAVGTAVYSTNVTIAP